MNRKQFCSGRRQKECMAQCVLLLALLIGSFYVLREYLFGNSLLVFNDIGSDTWQQYVMQYATVVNHLKEGNFTLWDFNNGFGTNMLSMNLFDPSLMLLYLLGVLSGTQKMLYFLSWIQVLRILLAGLVFYRYLSMFSYQIPTKFTLAFVYGFNGYLMVWGQHYQFGMVTIYLPLLLIFAEKYLRKEKGRCFFPVMTAICCVYSVYLAYMCLITVGFYLIFRLWIMDIEGMRTRIRKFFGGCVQILLGIGMSCMIFLPSAYTMLGVSGRVSGGGMGIWKWIKTYVSLFPRAYYESVLMRVCSSNLQETYQLADGKFELYLNYYEDPVLFVSNIVLILAIQMVFVFWRSEEKRRVKAAFYTAIVMCGLLLALPIGGCIFNAFQYTSHRHTFLFMPFLLLMAAWMWEYLQRSRKRSILAVMLTFFGIEGILYLGYRQSVYELHKENCIILAATSALMLWLLTFYPMVQKWKMKRCFTVLFFFLAAVNVLSDGKTAYSERITLKKDDAEYFKEMYSEDVQEALAWLKNYDTEFYRVEKDYSAGTIAMDALVQGYYGVSTYNSTLNKNLKEFLELAYPGIFLYDPNHVVFWNSAEDSFMASFFGVRYLLSKEADLEEASYRLLKQFGDVYVYENSLETSVARFYETAVSEVTFRKLCKNDEREEVLKNVIAIRDLENPITLKKARKWIREASHTDENPKAGNTDPSAVTLDSLEKHSKVTGRVEASTNGYVMVMIPYEQGWSLTVDGEEAQLLCADLGFLSFKVEEGSHEFQLTFETEMLREGWMVSIFFWCIYGVWIFTEQRKKHRRG